MCIGLESIIGVENNHKVLHQWQGNENVQSFYFRVVLEGVLLLTECNRTVCFKYAGDNYKLLLIY